MKLANNDFLNTINDYDGAELILDIYTAFELSNEEYKEIANKVSKKFNFIIKEVHVSIDESLIGGVKVVFDSNVIDGSLKGKLQEIKNKTEKRIL